MAVRLNGGRIICKNRPTHRHLYDSLSHSHGTPHYELCFKRRALTAIISRKLLFSSRFYVRNPEFLSLSLSLSLSVYLPCFLYYIRYTT